MAPNDESPPTAALPDTNSDAIRLWLIDMAATHLSRNQGVLGLGAHAVQQSLREEKDAIVKRLTKLGDRLQPEEQRRRA